MRIKVWYAILACTFYFSCDDDDYPYSEIPSVVRNSFWSEFPNAIDAEFSRSGENYEVKFESGGEDSEALIASTGTVLSEKKKISWEALPAAVRNSLQKEFGEEKIEDPEIIKSGEKVYYQVQIKRFLSNKKLVLNKKGKRASSSGF